MDDANNLKLCRITPERRLDLKTFVPSKGSIYFLESQKTIMVGDGETYGGIRMVTFSDLYNRENLLVKKSANRGNLAGYSLRTLKEISGTTENIDINYPDDATLHVSGNCVLNFVLPTDLSQCATKVIHLYATATATLTYQNCTWGDNLSAPTFGTAGKSMILTVRFSEGSALVSQYMTF